MLHWFKKIYKGKTNRSQYILGSLIGAFSFIILAFLVGFLVLAIFGSETTRGNPSITLVPLALLVVIYAIYQHVLNNRRQNDTGQDDDFFLAMRTLPFIKAFYELYLVFAKGKNRQKPTEKSHQ